MHIRKLAIRNFRLLADVELALEKRTTVIVGRNNSGKTSLTELFRRLLSDNVPRFRFEDFSLSSHERFWSAFLRKRQGEEEHAIRSALPMIEVTVTISYAGDGANLGPLSEFIIDLNPACTDAVIVVRYELKAGALKSLLDELAIDPAHPVEKQKSQLCLALKERVPKCYEASVTAVDPNDATNQKSLEWATVRALLRGGFINAQRGLDDVTHQDHDVLGRVLEALFQTACSDSSDTHDRTVAQKLDQAVAAMQRTIDESFNVELQALLPAFTLFGYPGLSDPRLRTSTTLDVTRLLSDHTRVQYAGLNGVSLPEGYNGLGVRNLIFILLKLLGFFKAFKADKDAPSIQLVFIEEPEVHLHPQMQSVFISKLAELASVFGAKFNGGKDWPVQFVVTTHSSHLANRASFDSMRYFHATPNDQDGAVRSTQIKDLHSGLGGTPVEDREFLHKYMTLTRCDLLFADKAVLVEGTTERLLLPRMITVLDAQAPAGPQLGSQYLSVVEVGGAYSHIFLPLLTFLQLPTLIITDIDSVKPAPNGKACLVSEGTHTSNASLKGWFADDQVSPATLVSKTDADKTRGLLRLAYQVPEVAGHPCGRSFEAAFILANLSQFGLASEPAAELEGKAWDLAASVAKKSDFAIEQAMATTQWSVPRYILDGLRWLSSPPPAPTNAVADAQIAPMWAAATTSAAAGAANA